MLIHNPAHVQRTLWYHVLATALRDDKSISRHFSDWGLGLFAGTDKKLPAEPRPPRARLDCRAATHAMSGHAALAIHLTCSDTNVFVPSPTDADATARATSPGLTGTTASTPTAGTDAADDVYLLWRSYLSHGQNMSIMPRRPHGVRDIGSAARPMSPGSSRRARQRAAARAQDRRVAALMNPIPQHATSVQ